MLILLARPKKEACEANSDGGSLLEVLIKFFRMSFHQSVFHDKYEFLLGTKGALSELVP